MYSTTHATFGLLSGTIACLRFRKEITNQTFLLVQIASAIGSTFGDWPILYRIMATMIIKLPSVKNFAWVNDSDEDLHSTIYLGLIWVMVGLLASKKSFECRLITHQFFLGYLLHILVDAMTHGALPNLNGNTYTEPLGFPLGKWLGVWDYHPDSGIMPRREEMVIWTIAGVAWITLTCWWYYQPKKISQAS